MRWAGHEARMDEGRSAFKILTGKPTGKRPLWKSSRVGGRTILEWTLKKWVSTRGIGLIWFRIGIIGEPGPIFHGVSWLIHFIAINCKYCNYQLF